MTSRTLNLAFVGSGNWARRYHFPALAYLQNDETLPYTLHLCGIYSLEPEVATGVAHCYGFDQVYPTLDALIDDPTVNAVAVAVAPEAAKLVIERVAQKRVPIFSEKPPGISVAEAEALSELVDLPNVVAFNRRYAPLNNRFKTIVDDLEDITLVEGHFLRHQRLDETFMVGTGIHWINFMTYLFGEIDEARVKRWRNPKNASWLRTADLVFAGGLRGFLKILPCTGSQVELMEVHTNEVSAYLEGPLWQMPGKIVIDRDEDHEVIELEAKRALPEVVRLGIVDEYREFCDVVLAGAASRSTFQNAVNAMRIAEAMELGVNYP